MSVVDPSIFKAYDVRGLHPDEIDEDVAYRIGRAFARVLGDLEGKAPADLTVGLGRDMRLSAPELADRYAAGLTDEGADVLDVGMVGTEMLYYAVGSRGLDGGLMCTASHNPKAYTGAKLVKQGSIALSGDSGIGELRDLVAEGEPGPPVEQPGSRERADVAPDFRQTTLSWIDPSAIRPMRVVLDGGNGMAGQMVGPLLNDLPLDQVPAYWEPDGELPGHEPNPLLPENREFIVDKLLETEAELGIAWDGDADRCFFIDDTGRFVDGDFLCTLLAESILEREPGAEILYDVRASRAVADRVEAAGGSAHVNRVGHAFFKTRMRDEGAAFGGEVSGHYYFRDFYNADSGTLPALLILELLSKSGKSMSELLAPLHERYFISGEINSEVSDQEAKMNELAERHSDAEVSWLDGVSVDYEDWHFNVRPSNTEALLRLNLESLRSEDHMAQKRDEVLALIRA
ncbi:MAG: phosphomannomutase/phosphoglucomutase [Actinomycetota bacterium]|nr:phosphomannomutase/phosphoglucomutase [Actinomycetota bacterium]MDQ3648067.1 phosphomannomutase/phosphoglucomutase [Actinomycetota bacterium]